MAFGLERNVFHRRTAGCAATLDNHPALKLHKQKENRMPTRRKSMRKTKEVLRLRFELGLGQRQIARSCGMGLGDMVDNIRRQDRPEGTSVSYFFSRG